MSALQAVPSLIRRTYAESWMPKFSQIHSIKHEFTWLGASTRAQCPVSTWRLVKRVIWRSMSPERNDLTSGLVLLDSINSAGTSIFVWPRLISLSMKSINVRSYQRLTQVRRQSLAFAYGTNSLNGFISVLKILMSRHRESHECRAVHFESTRLYNTPAPNSKLASTRYSAKVFMLAFGVSNFGSPSSGKMWNWIPLYKLNGSSPRKVVLSPIEIDEAVLDPWVVW